MLELLSSRRICLINKWKRFNDAPDASDDFVTGNKDQSFALNPTLPVDVDDAQSVLTVVVGQVPQASQGSLSYTLDDGGAGTVLPG